MRGGILKLLISAAILLGVAYLYLKQMPTTDKGTAATQAISLTGVRKDLLNIGQAERMFVVQNARCASLDELISSNSLTMAASGRDGYSYSVECSGTDFSVTASHPAAPADSPIRYPKLALDATMQVREIGE
jgi:hypothetical protein